MLQIVIYGGIFFQNNNHSPFDELTTDKFRLAAHINENDCPSKLEMRTLTLNGQPAIQIYKWKSMEGSTGCYPIIPRGFYYLMKQ